MNNKIISGNQNTTKLLNQLKASSKQYPPLNKEQERRLIEKYRDDREKLNQLLFMHNIKMVFNLAKKYMSKTNDFDGLVQEGMNGLGEAAKRFDIDKGIKFCTYAHIWIRKYILAAFYGKQVEVSKRSISLNSPNMYTLLKSNNGNEVTFENYVNEHIEPTLNSSGIQSIENSLSANEQKSICKDLMNQLDQDNSLSATEKHIFVDMYYNKQKPKELIKKYNVTQQEISQIKNIIIAKFRNILHNKYNIHSINDILM